MDARQRSRTRPSATWCERINILAPEQRDERDLYDALLSRRVLCEWESTTERDVELLYFGQLRRAELTKHECLL